MLEFSQNCHKKDIFSSKEYTEFLVEIIKALHFLHFQETYYSDSFSWICLFQQQTMWYYLRSLCINEKPRQRHTDWFINLWYDSVIWYNFIAYTSMKMHQHNLKKPRDLPLHWRRRRAKTTTRMVYWTCGRKNYHLDNWISDWKPLDEISFQLMCQDNLKTWIVIYDYAGILFYE